MKFKEVMQEADSRSQAVRHNDDWEDDNGQEDVASIGDAPYAIIWHAQYHEWYGAGDPATGEGRYKPKGDAGAVLAKNIPSYKQAQELLTHPKIEKVAQEHGEWGKDLMLISQSTGPQIVPMSELKDHFYGYDPDMQEYGAKPEQYDHHTVIDMANKEGVNEEIDHFANAIKMINSIITEIDENYHERMELIEGPAGLRYMFSYWRNSPHTKDRVDELKKYAAEKLHEVDSKPEHVKWSKQKPWERDYGPPPTVDEGHITLPPIDSERYGERPGLEGPFRARNGRVVYYDPIEGMYYDPDTDIYISNDDWEAMNEDQQLNEIAFLPFLVPALATAVRIGAPAVGRFLAKQFVKQAPKVVKGTGKVTKNVVKGTAKAIIKNPTKVATGVGAYYIFDKVTDAVDYITGLAEDLIDSLTAENLAKVVVKYSIPAGAVVAILWGGSKLWDYMKGLEKEEEMELPPETKYK